MKKNSSGIWKREDIRREYVKLCLLLHLFCRNNVTVLNKLEIEGYMTGVYDEE